MARRGQRQDWPAEDEIPGGPAPWPGRRAGLCASCLASQSKGGRPQSTSGQGVQCSWHPAERKPWRSRLADDCTSKSPLTTRCWAAKLGRQVGLPPTGCGRWTGRPQAEAGGWVASAGRRRAVSSRWTKAERGGLLRSAMKVGPCPPAGEPRVMLGLGGWNPATGP